MRKTVSPSSNHTSHWPATPPSLYGARGRKYLTHGELLRVLSAAEKAREEEGLLARLLAMTGARISEAMNLTPALCNVEDAVIAFVTLKRRCLSIREVPIPATLMRDLDRHFSIRDAQCDPSRAHKPLWKQHRGSGWRWIKRVMQVAGVEGSPATPRGLRHSFCIQAIEAGAPLPLVQKWVGHSRATTTAIYLQFCGAEERHLAARFWRRCEAERIAASTPERLAA